jgi:Tfp pilus assembly protein PilE
MSHAVVSRGAQRGLSMIGFLFVAAVVLVVALLAFRMIPAYIEYYTIQKALENALAEVNDPTLLNVRRAVERKLDADYADAVTAKDVELQKSGNTVTVSAAWDRKLPLVHNVSLLIEFHASASR